MMRKVTITDQLPSGAVTFPVPVLEKCRVLGGYVSTAASRGSSKKVTIYKGATAVAEATIDDADTAPVNIVPITTSGADKSVFDKSAPILVTCDAGTATAIGIVLELDPFLIGSK